MRFSALPLPARRPGRFLLSAGIGLGALLALATPALAADAPRLIGYVGGQADPATIEVQPLSALIFAFAHLDDGRIVLNAAARAAFARLQASVRPRKPSLELLISVGGWTSGGFSEAAMSTTTRQRFADSAVALLRLTGADGLDVDWEYPGHSESGIQSGPHDRENFTALLRTTRQALDHAGQQRAVADPSPLPHHYLLTAALADGPLVDHVQLRAVAAQLDWINMMTYDFNNAMTPTTGNQASLFASAASHSTADRTTNRAVQQYLAAGVPAPKLVLGAAFYGRAFADVRDCDHGLYQPYGTFYKVIGWTDRRAHYINRNGYKAFWDAHAQAPYLWNASTRTFVSYENPRSLTLKARYAVEHHLGGVMYWKQSLDPHNTLFDALARGLGRLPPRPAGAAAHQEPVGFWSGALRIGPCGPSSGRFLRPEPRWAETSPGICSRTADGSARPTKPDWLLGNQHAAALPAADR